jgi:hypothetical protein
MSDDERSGSFADDMPEDEKKRYEDYWTEDHAPVEGSPYQIKARFTKEGNYHQFTTYDENGDRHIQYDFNDPKYGDHQHAFESSSQYPRPHGKRDDEHKPIE